MKVEEVLQKENVGKKYKFEYKGQEFISEVKYKWIGGWIKISLDFIDDLEFEEVK